jgi:C1A family cysteine protease
MYKITVVAAMVAAALAANARPREVYETAFAEHVNKYSLTFKNGQEFVQKLQTFADNMDAIEEHNSKNLSYKMGVNKFSHMTLEEFRDSVHLGAIRPPALRSSNAVHEATPEALAAAPAAIDWVAQGKVTPVKNQGSCGSCWSFSATGAIEGAYLIKNGPFASTKTGLSEQQLVSCDTTDLGCNGGWMDDAFDWTAKNGGLCTEEAYPYASSTGTAPKCTTGCSVVAGTAPKSHTDVKAGDVNALTTAVAQQPVSIAIQANQAAFQSYTSGVITGRCGNRLDHGVLAVGYGTWTDGTPYWKVKNSWGTDWGMDGYVLIEKSSADLCGVLDAASYPTL